jgi:hypothetical protein
MSSYLQSIFEKKFTLSDLKNKSFAEQKSILDSLSPENFSDMIYVFDFYYHHPSFQYEFLEKLKQVKNWNVYFDHDPPVPMIDLFFRIADDSLSMMDQALYYLYHFKVPLEILKKHFLKIYDYAILEYDNDSRKMRKESTLYNGIFVAYTKEQLRNIIDFLLDELDRYEGTSTLDNPYSDVLLILIEYAKTVDLLYDQEMRIFTPLRLERLDKIISRV